MALIQNYIIWCLISDLIISIKGQYHECPITDTNCHVGFGDVNNINNGYLSCDPGYMAACSTPLTSQCDLPCIVRPITSPFVWVGEYVNFYQAIQRCRDMGLVLVSVHNQTEADDVAGLCNQNTNSNGQCWIALIRDANETAFKWLDVTNATLNDGTVFPYFFDVYAHPHIPLSQDEAACGLTSGEDVTWADADCHTKRSFICAEPQRSKANEPSINPKSSYASHSSHNGGYKKWPTPYPTNPRPSYASPTSSRQQPSTSIPTALRLTPRPTDKPTVGPAAAAASTTNDPTSDPSYNPTAHPIPQGTVTPRPSTNEEVVEGPVPTTAPTNRPTEKPTVGPTAARSTTNEPTSQPTFDPNTQEPSTNPTTSYNPTTVAAATEQPTTMTPTTNPSSNPTTVEPTTSDPTWNPTSNPTTSSPSTNVPTTIEPTLNPTTMELTSKPSANPTTATTMTPTLNPTTSNPTTKEPSSNPSINPTVNPIPKATNTPQPNTRVPFDDVPMPTAARSTTNEPTSQPTTATTTTEQPTTMKLTSNPSANPSINPTVSPISKAIITSPPSTNEEKENVPMPTSDPLTSSSYPTSVPTKTPNKDSHVLFWCIVGLCLFVIFAVIACYVLRKRRKKIKKIGNQKYEQVDYNGYNGSNQEKAVKCGQEPEIINIHETYALNEYDDQIYTESQVCEE